MGVNVDLLSRRMGKYALVVAASQRARELKDRYARIGDLNPQNLIGRALREIQEGKVKLLEERVEE
jgi:DNA-directed RNA polymerase omega subunit